MELYFFYYILSGGTQFHFVLLMLTLLKIFYARLLNASLIFLFCFEKLYKYLFIKLSIYSFLSIRIYGFLFYSMSSNLLILLFILMLKLS